MRPTFRNCVGDSFSPRWNQGIVALMRMLNTLIVVLLTTIPLCAQASSQPQGQHDVVVLEHNWRVRRQDVSPGSSPGSDADKAPAQPRMPNDPSPEPVRNASLSMPTVRGPKFVTEYIYTLKVKNTAAMSIKILGWDYIFLDPATQEEMGKHHFQSVVNIGPGKPATIAHSTSSPPSKVVTTSGLNKKAQQQFTERILITCIKYKDGSVWVADPARSKTCEPPPVR